MAKRTNPSRRHSRFSISVKLTALVHGAFSISRYLSCSSSDAGAKSMIVKGDLGSFELLEDCVVIRRSGLIGSLLRLGDERIPYSSITALQVKRPGMLYGFIRFTIGGDKKMNEIGLAFSDAAAFDKAYEFLQKKIGRLAKPFASAAPSASVADQLEKLAGLLERGLLTKEEFDSQKSSLLGLTA
jgi:hypothetical protein